MDYTNGVIGPSNFILLEEMIRVVIIIHRAVHRWWFFVGFPRRARKIIPIHYHRYFHIYILYNIIYRYVRCDMGIYRNIVYTYCSSVNLLFHSLTTSVNISYNYYRCEPKWTMWFSVYSNTHTILPYVLFIITYFFFFHIF